MRTQKKTSQSTDRWVTEPEVYHPAPVSATVTVPGRGRSGRGKLGMRVRVHDMISHRQVLRMPGTCREGCVLLSSPA